MTSTTNDASTDSITAQPENVHGFGIAEVSYLLQKYAGDTTQRTADLIKLDDNYLTQEIATSGASSLIARGWAEADDRDGGTITPQGPAAALAACFALASRWIQLAYLQPEHTDVAMYLQSGEAAVLLQPRSVGTFYCLFKEPGAPNTDVLRRAVDAGLADDPKFVVYLGASTSDEEVDLFVRRTDEGSWRIAFTAEGKSPDESIVDDAGLRTALERVCGSAHEEVWGG